MNEYRSKHLLHILGLQPPKYIMLSIISVKLLISDAYFFSEALADEVKIPYAAWCVLYAQANLGQIWK